VVRRVIIARTVVSRDKLIILLCNSSLRRHNLHQQVPVKTAASQKYMEVDIYYQTHQCPLNIGGCDHSIIPRKLNPTAFLEPGLVDVTTANGSSINILGQMTIKFSIRGKELKADLLVADNMDKFMLGFKWLTAQKAKWNFDARTPTIPGLTVPLFIRPSHVGIRRVYVKEHSAKYGTKYKNKAYKFNVAADEYSIQNKYRRMYPKLGFCY